MTGDPVRRHLRSAVADWASPPCCWRSCQNRTWLRGSGWWTAASSATGWSSSSRSRRWVPWRPRRRCEGGAARGRKAAARAARASAGGAAGDACRRRRACWPPATAAPRVPATHVLIPLAPACRACPHCSGLDVLPKFAGFLKSSPEEAAAKEGELVACLQGLDAHLGGCGRAAAAGWLQWLAAAPPTRAWFSRRLLLVCYAAPAARFAARHACCARVPRSCGCPACPPPRSGPRPLHRRRGALRHRLRRHAAALPHAGTPGRRWQGLCSRSCWAASAVLVLCL